VNAIKAMGMLPGGTIASAYLTDPDAWFIKTDVSNGMKYFERVADSFSMDDDFETDNAKFKARGRYSFSVSDKRSIFGTGGA
jgi:hypothetical protein